MQRRFGHHWQKTLITPFHALATTVWTATLNELWILELKDLRR